MQIIYNYFLSCSSFSLKSSFNTNIRTAGAGKVSVKLSNFFPQIAHIYKFISHCAATELGSSLNCMCNIKVKNQAVAIIRRLGLTTYDFREVSA